MPHRRWWWQGRGGEAALWIAGTEADRLALAGAAALCNTPCPMADPRISHIELDDATIIWRNADIEQERRVAVYDLIEENTLKPVRAFAAGHEGPYRLRLSVEDGRLMLAISD